MYFYTERRKMPLPAITLLTFTRHVNIFLAKEKEDSTRGFDDD